MVFCFQWARPQAGANQASPRPMFSNCLYGLLLWFIPSDSATLPLLVWAFMEGQLKPLRLWQPWLGETWRLTGEVGSLNGLLEATSFVLDHPLGHLRDHATSILEPAAFFSPHPQDGTADSMLLFTSDKSICQNLPCVVCVASFLIWQKLISLCWLHPACFCGGEK